VDSINGWSREQLVFFVGTFSLVDGLEMLLFFFGLSSIPEKIRTGKLDLYLTKPISPLFHITFESLDVGSGFLTLPGLVMVVWATVKMGIPITIGRVAGYLVLLALMLMLLYDLMLIMRAVAFRVVQTGALEELEGELMGFAFRVPGIVFQGVPAAVLRVSALCVAGHHTNTVFHRLPVLWRLDGRAGCHRFLHPPGPPCLAVGPEPVRKHRALTEIKHRQAQAHHRFLFPVSPERKREEFTQFLLFSLSKMIRLNCRQCFRCCETMAVLAGDPAEIQPGLPQTDRQEYCRRCRSP
jgi:hypothetical protein